METLAGGGPPSVCGVLEYLWEAKRLNPRQARWALLFAQFQFTISYCRGTKNTKTDALSSLYSSDDLSENPEHILPSTMIASPIQWSLDEDIAASSVSDPAPPGCPATHTLPLTIWKASPSSYSLASMVTPRSGFRYRLASIRW